MMEESYFNSLILHCDCCWLKNPFFHMFCIKATKLYIENVHTTPPTTQYTESDIIKPTCRAPCPSADFSDFQRRHKRCLNERCFCISLNIFNCGNSSTSASSSLLLDIFDYAHKIFALLFLLFFFLSLFHCFVTCRTSSARLCVYGICDWNYWTSSSSTYHKSTWIKWHKITTTKKNLDRKNLFAFIIWTVVQWWLHYKFARSVVGTDVRLLYLANTKLTWIHGFTLYIFPFSNLYRPFIFQIQVS